MQSIRIAGLDVSRGSVTVAILSELPTIDLRSFVRRCKTLRFKVAQINELLALEFDAAVLEPTGMHYARLWAEMIVQSGREVRWVGHREVKGYRESWRLPDKTDKTDAIALACYGLERWHNHSYFIDPRVAEAARLRELYLQLQFLNRSCTPLINRLRQQLAWECPELSEKPATRLWLGNACGMWRAIAGQATPKWKAMIDNSKGLGIGRFSCSLAAQIVSNELEQCRIESEIELLLKLPQFGCYLEAMQPFYFGHRTSTAILGAVYPIEKFKGHRNPLGAFKLSCGLAQVWHQSGEYTGWVAGGDVTIRNALWMWARAATPPRKGGYSYSSPELEALREYYVNGTDVEKDGEIEHLEPGKGSQRLMRVARRALTMLYRKLK